MKRIKLTQGQFALVDDGDYDWLSQWKWCACKNHGNFYAMRRFPLENGKYTTIKMARQILGLTRGDKRQADHIDHNTLDNRQGNLRICTIQQNQMNQKSNRNSFSQFKGVSWNKLGRKWCASIRVSNKLKYLGLFNKEERAALAYNKAAKKYFGEFACLNSV